MAVGRTNVRVVVVGDRGTGKSSLISAVASEAFPDTVPHVLPPTRLSPDTFPDGVPITIIDTSSSLESKGKLAEELKRADVVLLTYACDQPASLDHLGNFWLHEFRRLEVKVPVIVVGCKLDLRDERFPVSLDQIMAPVMQQFREIETCIECSAANLVQVPEVFYFAQKAVLHPTSPLFDQDTQALKPRSMRALKRIFVLCDQDMDGVLNDTELNEFQVKCFNTPLQPAEMVGVKRVVQEKLPEGVNEFGLTLTGFLFLHALFIEKGCLETTWTVLRKFGYDDTLNLREDQLSVPSTKAPDQTVELTSEAMEFLKGVFSLFDADKDGALRLPELEDLFSTAPESPWDESPYRDAAERSAFGGISLNGFLSEWALMTLLDPTKGLANLIYIGYTSHPASALRVTRRRSIDRKKQQTDRNVFQCFVFGPKGSGKSSLLKSFLGRPFMETTYSKAEERYVANIVDRPGRTKKILVLREIPEDGVKMLLEKKEAMAACDVAAFVYDGSDEYSLKRASELLMEVTKKGEETGFLVPSLLIATKDDIDSYPLAIKESAEICQDMGIDAPIHISVKEGDLNNVFCRIVNAADRPNLNIPETEMGRKQKHFHQFVNRSIMLVSVGAAVVMVGLAAYRTYAARKNTSS
ncbi:mitochondrial Rho GTPase 2-like [Impatiens glandulifera]|uniref:mitochondrial Rho GTPase 2-like n=1 Tax=Impatiens glandulifera TaxID=253017 RepID=UPI001FB05FEB|nr:mitochondrial Rho GTPase 2-like [Impatiens glandulifera]